MKNLFTTFAVLSLMTSTALAATVTTANLPEGYVVLPGEEVVVAKSDRTCKDGTGANKTCKAKISDQVLANMKAYGAICDGTSNTLADASRSDPTTGYGTLAAAQVDYPAADALTEEIDTAVFEYLVSNNIPFFVPSGTCLINKELSFASKTLHIDSHSDGVLQGSGVEKDTMITCSSCDVELANLNLDGQNVFQQGLSLSAPSPLIIENFEGFDFGWSVTVATNLVTPLSLSGDLGDFTINGFRVTDLTAVGDGTFGNSSGGARALVITPASSSNDIAGVVNDFYFDAVGSDAEELDVFNMNVNSTYPSSITFNAPYIAYNGNTRRMIKVHSGDLILNNPTFVKATDFVTAPTALTTTSVGAKTLTAVDMAGSQQGSIMINGGRIDVAGYPTGFSSTAGCTDCFVRAYGTEFIGASYAIDRTNPETGAPQTGSPISFATGTGDDGSGCFECFFTGGYIGAQLRGDHSFLKNCYFKDPVYHGWWVNATNKKGIVVDGNIIVSETSGRLYDGFRVAPVQGTNATVTITNNELRQDGNTTHRCDFIDVLTSSVTGVFGFNKSPSSCYGGGTMRTIDNDIGASIQLLANDYKKNSIYDTDISLNDVEDDLGANGYYIMKHYPTANSAAVKSPLYGQMELWTEFGSTGAGHTIGVIGRNENNGIGSDLVTNGTFATDTGWTKGTDWAIGSGVATVTTAAAPTLLEQAITLVDGATYRVTYTISGYSAGSITPIAGGTSSTTRAANGTYTEDIVAGATDSVQFYADTGTTASIDNVTLKRIRQEVLGIGVEGRIDPVVGNYTTGAAFVATFGEDVDMLGSTTYGIGYFMPTLSDDGNITYKYSLFLDDADWTARIDGPTEFNSGVTPVVTTVAALGTPAAGTIKTISDGTGATDCTVGGAATFNVCVYNGSAWQDLN